MATTTLNSREDRAMPNHDPEAEARAEALLARLTTGRSYLTAPPTKRRVTASQAAEIAAEALEIVYRLSYDLLSENERQAVSRVRHACAEIADGDRS